MKLNQFYDNSQFCTFIRTTAPLLPGSEVGTASGSTEQVGPGVAGLGVNTKVANVLGMCAVTLPSCPVAAANPANTGLRCLPVGLDVLCKPNGELKALEIGLLIDPHLLAA